MATDALDFDAFPYVVLAVINALPDDLSAAWREHLAASPGLTAVTPPDADGWIATFVDGAQVCRIHRDTFIPGTDRGRALVFVDGVEHELVLALIPDAEL